MPVADLAQALPVARRRHETAARVLDRLGDDHRHGLGRLELDRRLDLLEQRLAERLGIVARRVPVGVGRGDVPGRDRQRLERRPADRHAGEREGAHRHPVVGVTAGDHLATLRLALGRVPLDGDLVGRLDRLRTARGEEDAVEAVGRQRGDLRRGLDRARVSDRPVRAERELDHLLEGSGPDLLAVGVTEVRAVQAREAVDVAVALAVEDVVALAAVDHGDLRAVDRHVGEVQHQVLLGQLLQGRGVRHGWDPLAWGGCGENSSICRLRADSAPGTRRNPRAFELLREPILTYLPCSQLHELSGSLDGIETSTGTAATSNGAGPTPRVPAPGGRDFDAIIVGGGHNGLTTAAYLAHGGLRVCVLERRPILGGACVTEEVWPGARISRASYVVSMLQPKVVRDLRLADYGYKAVPARSRLRRAHRAGTDLLLQRDGAHAGVDRPLLEAPTPPPTRPSRTC